MNSKPLSCLQWFINSTPESPTPSFWRWYHPREFKGLCDCRKKKLQELADQNYLEVLGDINRKDCQYRITQNGYLTALAGRDPEQQWKRHWDGIWRFFVYAVPEKERVIRVRLRNLLKSHHFGYLQRGVWIAPDKVSLKAEKLEDLGIDKNFYTIIKGAPKCGEDSLSLISNSWDFQKIDRAWGCFSDHLETLNTVFESGNVFTLKRWFKKKNHYWKQITISDPFLPNCLHPKGYKGKKIWEIQKKVMASFAKNIRKFM